MPLEVWRGAIPHFRKVVGAESICEGQYLRSGKVMLMYQADVEYFRVWTTKEAGLQRPRAVNYYLVA